MPLLTTDTVPPGCWRYQQKDAAGADFKYFHSCGPYGDFLDEILGCRKGNNLPRATKAEVEQDVNAFQCVRLGNDPRYCQSGSGPVSMPKDTFYGQGPASPCGTCGGKRA